MAKQNSQNQNRQLADQLQLLVNLFQYHILHSQQLQNEHNYSEHDKKSKHNRQLHALPNRKLKLKTGINRSKINQLNRLSKRYKKIKTFSKNPKINGEMREAVKSIKKTINPVKQQQQQQNKSSQLPLNSIKSVINKIKPNYIVENYIPFDNVEPQNVTKRNSIYTTDHKQVNKTLNQRRTINILKSQSILNKNDENNYVKNLPVSSEIITYGNKLIVRAKEQGEISFQEKLKQLYLNVFNNQYLCSYRINRLDYVLLARKISQTIEPLYCQQQDFVFQTSFLSILKTYYLKTVQNKNMIVKLSPLENQCYLEMENEIISKILGLNYFQQYDLKDFKKSIVTVAVRNHKHLIETDNNQTVYLIILEIIDNVQVTFNLKNRLRNETLEVYENQLITIPPNCKLSFNQGLEAKSCLLLEFWSES